MTEAISKQLTPNDTGETGGHQAGILVPKDPDVLAFFPSIDLTLKNPRHHLVFEDETGDRWEFAFIYYNNALFGGTRNEYRLTRMTPFIRQHNLRAGDTLTLTRIAGSDRRRISFARLRKVQVSPSGRIKLGSSWKTVEMKGGGHG